MMRTESDDGDSASPSAGLLGSVCAMLQELQTPATEAEAIDQVAYLTKIANICAAGIAHATEEFRTQRLERETQEGVPERRRGVGINQEIALARGESPQRVNSCIRLATALEEDLPHTYQALREGRINEQKARIIASKTQDLSPENRRQVDKDIKDYVESLGLRMLAARVNQLGEDLEPEVAIVTHERCKDERYVTVSPTADGMAYLRAYLPLVEASMVQKALHDAALSANAHGRGDGRTYQQLVADTLVERCVQLPADGHVEAMPGVGGLATEGSSDTNPSVANPNPAKPSVKPQVRVEIGLVMTDQALLGDDDSSAVVPGYGTIPAGIVRKMVGESGDDAHVYLRRLYARPHDGQLIGMDSASRIFPSQLRKLVVYRDQVCRTPGCDAPIKHLDHATPVKDGGETSWNNASGLCASCNYAKEAAGWKHEAKPEHLTVTTPTGHTYSKPTMPPFPHAQRT